MKFEQLLHKVISSKSFCLVGNGPEEIGKAQGTKIDAYDTVIRFNDFSLESSKDYGKKVDIWVRAANDQVIETLNEKIEKDYRVIFFRSLNKRNKKTVDYLSSQNKKVISFPISYENRLSKILHSPPSTGLLFMYILKQNDFKIKKNFFGFSFFDKDNLKEYGNYHYYNVKTNKKSLGIDLAKHNWQAEKKFFNKFILEK